MAADTTPQALVRVYEPEKDQWQALTSMPTPRYGATSFLRGNKIYVLGGRQGKLPVTAFEAFDLEMKSWTHYPCIPSRRAFACCAATERGFFSLGGLQQPCPHNFYSRPHFVSTVEEYNPEQGNQPSPLSSVESYNLVKRRWEYAAPMPSPRCCCAPLQTPNMLFLIGGVAQGPSNAVEALCLRETV
ncbi:kelch domain-containing protein 8B [Salvelinus sp. IW2-2015]|uniref:kelch domain-containing protein 8B n=1 Tax=Salvelinus sp. IW2-2015 TaxID=2691554 RepID=UPI000CDF93BA|nr:kelch domain-containing protein 8B [Salvelinus alpinus]